MRRSPGFTLIEVLVALAVLGVALSVALRVAAGQVEAVQRLRDETLAHWVAMNQLARVRVAGSALSAGSEEGVERMGERAWHWSLEVRPSGTTGLWHARVDVRRDEADAWPLLSRALLVGALP